MFDIDHFKRFNDTYGHLQGDIIIKEISRILIASTRSIDVCARYGGEEFAVILIEIERPAAGEVAERLRRMVEAARASFDGAELGVTASFGVACFPDDAEDKQKLIEAADSALYRAKAAGRNRVCLAPALPPEKPGPPDGVDRA